MICVECLNTVPSLYTRFANGYIKLAYCSRCNEVCDKYVEFDLVILFIDILLLKPPAYKHLVFNVLLRHTDNQARMAKQATVLFAETKDESPNKICPKNNEYSEESWGSHLKNRIKDYVTAKKKALAKVAQPSRLAVSFILFEVYLNWAYEELKPENTILFATILRQPTFVQYLIFLIQCCVEFAIAHLIIQNAILYLYKGTKQAQQYPVLFTREAISTTVLVAGGTKLYPILMLIWPYDSQISTTLINHYYTNVTMIEALRISIGIKFHESVLIVFLATLTKKVVSALLIITFCKRFLLVDSFKDVTTAQICASEFNSVAESVAVSFEGAKKILVELFQ